MLEASKRHYHHEIVQTKYGVLEQTTIVQGARQYTKHGQYFIMD